MITRADLWWLDGLKVGDRLVIQPYWNETAKSEKLFGPLEVVAIRRNCRSQSGTLVSVKAEGQNFPTCLDAAWFIGPSEAKRRLSEDGWWRSEKHENEKRTEPQAGQVQAPNSRKRSRR